MIPYNKIPIKDLINQKYGRLTIVREVEPHILPCGQKERKVLCKCECGNYKEVRLSNLKRGSTQSCGCLQKEKFSNFKHGLRGHPLYRVWDGMKERCYNSNRKAFKNYGGRGIIIYKEWINNPKTFIEWALANGWQKGLEIDRENNDGNYEPDNCRFVTRGVNVRNTRLLMSTNTSGFRGVFWNKQRKKWMAYISIDGKLKNFGCFNSPRIAALRYDVEAFLLDDGRPLNFKERIYNYGKRNIKYQ